MSTSARRYTVEAVQYGKNGYSATIVPLGLELGHNETVTVYVFLGSRRRESVEPQIAGLALGEQLSSRSQHAARMSNGGSDGDNTSIQVTRTR